MPLGVEECALPCDEIASCKPDVIVNSLIGPSNVAFMQALSRKQTAPITVSCNQTEADLEELGPAADGMLSAGSFFEPLANETFRARALQAAPRGRISAMFATSYTAVQLLAASVAAAAGDDPRAVLRALTIREFPTVLGPVTIDPVTRHAALTSHLAQADSGRFNIIRSASAPEAADPYLTRVKTTKPARHGPQLRVVQ